MKINKALQMFYDFVLPSLGPKGKYLFINDGYRSFVTKDGATIVKHLQSEDIEIQTIIDIVSQASLKTNEEVGDGTTSSILYTYFIYNYFKDKPIEEFKSFKESCLKELNTLISKVTYITDQNKDKLIDIANIACAGDNIMAQLIGKMIWDLKDTGIIEIEESTNSEYDIKYFSGSKYDSKFVSPVFITNKAKRTVELKNPYIILSDVEITDFKTQIGDPYKKAQEKNIPLLIIAPKFSDEVLDLVYLNLNQGITIYLAYSPGFGETRQENLTDIDILTNNGEYNTSEKVIISDTEIQFINPKGLEIERKARSIFLQQLIDNCVEPVYISKLKTRKANFEGRAGKLYIPAETSAEYEEKYDRVEDAICATKAALKSGYIAGGGFAAISFKKYSDLFKSIIDYIYRDIPKHDKYDESHIYNINTNKLENISSTNIIEPIDVVLNSYKNAFSIVELLLNCGGIVTHKPITL